MVEVEVEGGEILRDGRALHQSSEGVASKFIDEIQGIVIGFLSLESRMQRLRFRAFSA